MANWVFGNDCFHNLDKFHRIEVEQQFDIEQCWIVGFHGSPETKEIIRIYNFGKGEPEYECWLKLALLLTGAEFKDICDFSENPKKDKGVTNV